MIRPNPVEVLEARIAPAFILTPEISADGKSAKFVDVDGDLFTVTTSKGTFTEGNFVYVGETETGPGYLQKIDLGLVTFGKMFQGAKIKVTVDEVVGDGFADVGFINAAGIDLKQALVDGDLVRIDVGNANVTTPAIGLLQAAQLGFHTITDAGVPDFISHVIGRINALEIGTWTDASIQVAGGPTEKTATLGSIGRASIQSLTGSDLEFSGTLAVAGSIGTLVMLGDVTGGSMNSTGVIFCGHRVGSLTIGGSILGGAGDLSGAVVSDAGGSLGIVVVGGSLEGSSGDFSGSIVGGGAIKSVSLNGDVKVGSAFLSGSVFGTSAKSITVAGNLIGGTAVGGILVEKKLGKLTLGGADGASGPAYIIVGGPLSGGTAVGRIAVTHSLNGARILAGYNPDLQLMNPNARIGKITVGEDLIATDIVAGIDGVNGVFGDADDRVSPDDTKPAFLSSIASIIVGGMIAGTEGGTDQFGILAERIGIVQIGEEILSLGKKTVDDLQLGATGDYRLRELTAVV